MRGSPCVGHAAEAETILGTLHVHYMTVLQTRPLIPRLAAISLCKTMNLSMLNIEYHAAAPETISEHFDRALWADEGGGWR